MIGPGATSINTQEAGLAAVMKDVETICPDASGAVADEQWIWPWRHGGDAAGSES